MSDSPKLIILGDELVEKSVDATPLQEKRIEQYKSQIDLNKSSAMQFGVVSQNQLGAFSEIVLKQIRTQNALGIDTTLAKLVSELKSFDKSISQWSVFSVFESSEKRISRINDQYQNTAKIIFEIERELERQHKKLSVDLKVLEKMFEENKRHFEDLSLYIYAGEWRLKEIRQDVLQQLKAEVTSSSDKQLEFRVSQLEEQISRFEKRVQDLRLSRIVAIQLATQIRLIQSNNTILLDKLQSCVMNTLPLWKNQMVMSLNIAKSQQMLKVHGSLSKVINRVLKRNNRTIRNSTAQISRESEQNIIELSTLQNINQDLFLAVSDVISVHQKTIELRNDAHL